ncbi:hypothetical protein Dimus_031063, partial [Dionaea muscipula]
MLTNKNKKAKGNRFLITVNVIGSAGPMRFIVNEKELVSAVINMVLKSYAREGRLPILGSDLNDFVLYCPSAESEALNPWETIGATGCRNFMLCKKPQSSKGDIAGKAAASPFSRRANGSLRSWINKSLSLKLATFHCYHGSTEQRGGLRPRNKYTFSFAKEKKNFIAIKFKPLAWEKVAVNPRVVSRVVDRVEEVAIVDPAGDSPKGEQLEEGIEVRHPSGRDELKSMGETKLPIELWGDEEGELVENSVTVEASLGSSFLYALRRKPEETETELRQLAGNRDMNRVGADLLPSVGSPGSQGKTVLREDEWHLVRGRAANVSAYSSAQEPQMQGESSGSRFSVL